ncbi:MAG: 4-alpha-glucanotransferase [Ruminococcaceae bacterium]|nr:4-alpha-glucanotransferase [Oscillospiraceae bacterium]
MKRSGGVLMHISSLSGKYGIGTMGENAKKFIDFLSECNFGIWQVLPCGPCDEYNSPYSGKSAFAGNIYFIDPEILYKKNLLTKEDLKECECENIYVTNYEFLYETREKIFRKAFGRFQSREKVADFVKENPWAEDYARFCALKNGNSLPWYEWEDGLKFRDEKTLSKVSEDLKEDILFYKFLQYEFFSQWNEMKKYANSKGVQIVGDMPIYLSHDSADVWANPHLFSLDKDMHLERCAGVPPDYFCEDGQMWGNPLYNWDNLKKENYSLWIDRLRHALSMYDAVRIDHFRAFSAYWSIPAGEKATKGRWEKGPGIEFFNTLKGIYPDANIIAEDLGDIDDDVRTLLKETGFPGMGVMQFAFITDDNTPHLPHNYTEKTVGYTGTHDNNTLLGWLWESDEKSRCYALDYCNFHGDWGQGGPHSESIRSIIRTLWSSGALITIVPIQDLCGFGGDTCMNHPGVADGNWCFRITEEALSSIDKDFYRKLNRLYKR